MNYPLNYDSPSELREFLENHELSMKKRFGQNFLVNKGAREKIVGLLGAEAGEKAWEIGPGLGSMTWHMLEKGFDLTVFEIDNGFANLLRDFYSDLPNFSIIQGDFLKTFKNEAETAGIPPFVIGNLPYSSGSPMIAMLIKNDLSPRTMVFTVQKEVAQRMAAKPGSKDYSVFSLISGSKYTVELSGDLKAGSFYPRPAVVSSVVKLTKHNSFDPGDPAVYYTLIDDMFLSRRKKISNNLASGRLAARFGREKVLDALNSSGISAERRGETVSVEEAQHLSRLISKEFN